MIDLICQVDAKELQASCFAIREILEVSRFVGRLH